MQEKPNPLDKARELINQKKVERLSEEDLKKQEEGTRLGLLFDEFRKLNEELEEIYKQNPGLTDQLNILSVERANQTSGIKQAVDVLRASEETKHLFSKEKPYINDPSISDDDKRKTKINFSEEEQSEIDKRHTERRETTEAVFSEVQNERRATKGKIKEVKQEKTLLDEKKNKIYRKIDELKRSPDWQKLIELKMDEYRQASRAEEIFNSNNDRSTRYWHAVCIEKVNQYVNENIESINRIKVKLKENIFEQRALYENTILNAENSSDYKIISNDENQELKINFKKYLESIPPVEELKIRIDDNGGRGHVKIKQLTWKYGVWHEVGKDIETTEKKLDLLKEEIRKIKDSFWKAGLKKKEKELSLFELKEKVLRSISKVFHHADIEMSREGDHGKKINILGVEDTLPMHLRKYVYNMQNISYDLREEKFFPDFKKELTIDEWFSWAKKNEITAEEQVALDEKRKLSSTREKAKLEYELLVGSGKALDIRF